MNLVTVACIVEGHGEVEALPVLLRRLSADVAPGFVPTISAVIRRPKSTLLKPGGIEAAAELAARTMSGPGGLVVLMDSDEDCPAKVGPALLRRVRETRRDLPAAVVLAKPEFETWFLAAAESLGGRRGLQATLAAPPEPETISDAKGWLTRHMRQGRHYEPVVDQAALAYIFDVRRARRADSFDKFYREVVGLLKKLKNTACD